MVSAIALFARSRFRRMETLSMLARTVRTSIGSARHTVLLGRPKQLFRDSRHNVYCKANESLARDGKRVRAVGDTFLSGGSFGKVRHETVREAWRRSPSRRIECRVGADLSRISGHAPSSFRDCQRRCRLANGIAISSAASEGHVRRSEKGGFNTDEEILGRAA